MKNNNNPTDEQILKEEADNAGRAEHAEEVPAAEESAETSEEQVKEEKAEPEQKEDAQTKEEEELQTKYLRLAADFQNYKRRVEKEKNDIYAFANEKLMVELLNVIDNFDRALAVETADSGMKEGMEMILKQIVDVLEKSGLEEVPSDGQEFDPNCHHAVQTECSDAHCSGQITKVLQKGYSLNKKVIRPSMVIVAE